MNCIRFVWFGLVCVAINSKASIRRRIKTRALFYYDGRRYSSSSSSRRRRSSRINREKERFILWMWDKHTHTHKGKQKHMDIGKEWGKQRGTEWERQGERWTCLCAAIKAEYGVCVCVSLWACSILFCLLLFTLNGGAAVVAPRESISIFTHSFRWNTINMCMVICSCFVFGHQINMFGEFSCILFGGGFLLLLAFIRLESIFATINAFFIAKLWESVA